MVDRSVAIAKLQQEVSVWEAVVDNLISGGARPKEAILLLKQTPLAMHILGADLAKNLFIAPQAFIGCLSCRGDLRTDIIKHNNITPAILKKIPKALTDPIAVFNYVDNSITKYTYILEIATHNKATVLANVDFNAQRTNGIPITLVSDIYTITKDGKPDNQWIIDNFVKAPAYCNRKKWKIWATKYFSDIYEDVGVYADGLVKYQQ